MALYTVQAVLATGITPTPITPTSSDTVSANDIANRGVVLRIVTTGTATNVQLVDPTLTDLGNAYNPVPLACPATGVRYLLVPPAAINQTLNPAAATVTFSSVTGVSVEATRF